MAHDPPPLGPRVGDPAPVAPRPEPLMPRVQWHYRAHEKWGKEELIFWFLKFNSMYEPTQVLTATDAVLSDHDVGAFACYEVMGLYDVLLRVWLPHGKRKEFDEALHSRLKDHGLRQTTFFEVEEVLRQWLWAPGPNETGAPLEPSAEFLAAKPGPRMVAALNAIGDLGDDAFEDPIFKLYSDQHVIAAKPRVRGIRLVTAIQPEPGEVTEPQIKRLGESLGDTLDRLAGVAQERSLYFGRGGDMSRFLVTCTIDYVDYHRFRTEILTEIGREITARGPIRTLTFPVTSSDYLSFRDHLPHERAPDPTIDELLQQEESQTFEVKGSAFSPLAPWFNGESDGPVERPAFPNDTILKAIASLLNTNDGTVVVGVLEESDYAQGAAVLGELGQVGRYRVAGLLDPTFAEAGKRGWDDFERKLQDVIAERIEPPPNRQLKIRREMCQDKELCVISVESPHIHRGYFVRSGGAAHFYVRRGAAVEELHGTDVISFLDERRERASGF